MPHPLIERNHRWSQHVNQKDARYFETQAAGQQPHYLWFGCSDSRVPPASILNLQPGDIFVQRNIANQTPGNDKGTKATLQFAVEALGVREIIVAGHTKCGGVQGVVSDSLSGDLDQWLRPLSRLAQRHKTKLRSLDSDEQRTELLCRLNVIEQVRNICLASPVRKVWADDREIAVHGWLYHLSTGRLDDLECTVTAGNSIEAILRKATTRLFAEFS